MIDGVKINPGTIGGAALQHIRPELIERVEVVKGPLSTLYGSGAIGGVVNIITKRAEGGLEAQAGAEVGSFDTRHWNAALRGSGARGRAGLAISRFDTEGFPIRVGPTLTAATIIQALTPAVPDLGPLDAEASHWQARGR
jgi:vitamin B12 transporter